MISTFYFDLGIFPTEKFMITGKRKDRFEMVMGKKLLCVITVIFPILLILSIECPAVDFDMSSTLNPVGSGARATGMGGAFIGVADDATAASWNPAGLIQLEKPEVSAVYGHFHRKQRYDSPSHPEINSYDSIDTDSLNYASAAYPFVLFNRNMIISLNYQRLYEMDKKIMGNYIWDIENNDPNVDLDVSSEFDMTRFGYLYALSPAMAVQIVPGLYIGATLNFWDNTMGSNGWESKKKFETTLDMLTIFPDVGSMEQHQLTTTHTTQDAAFEGINQHLGFLWEISDSLTLGGVYKTPFDADLKINQVQKTTDECTSTTTIFGVPTQADCSAAPVNNSEFINNTLRMPPAYGIGLSYRHSDSLTIAFDVYRTEWSRFVIRDGNNNEKNPLTGADINEGRLKDTTQVRMGMEYLFIRDKYAIPMRLGLFYDPEPATGHVDDFYGFSLGTGISYGNIVLDTSYQFRTGNDATGDLPAVEDSRVNIRQHVWMASMIYYL